MIHRPPCLSVKTLSVVAAALSVRHLSTRFWLVICLDADVTLYKQRDTANAKNRRTCGVMDPVSTVSIELHRNRSSSGSYHISITHRVFATGLVGLITEKTKPISNTYIFTMHTIFVAKVSGLID